MAEVQGFFRLLVQLCPAAKFIMDMLLGILTTMVWRSRTITSEL